MNTDLTKKLTRMLKERVGTKDIPKVLIEAVVAGVLDVLPCVFDAEDGTSPKWLSELGDEGWRELKLGRLLDEEEWALCEDGTLWPESLVALDCEGVCMPREFWEATRDESGPEEE